MTKQENIDPFQELLTHEKEEIKSREAIPKNTPLLKVEDGDRFYFKVLSKVIGVSRHGNQYCLLFLELRTASNPKLNKWKMFVPIWKSESYKIGNCYAGLGYRVGKYVNIACSDLESDFAKRMNFLPGW